MCFKEHLKKRLDGVVHMCDKTRRMVDIRFLFIQIREKAEVEAEKARRLEKEKEAKKTTK